MPGVITSCSGCLFSYAMSGNSASITIFVDIYFSGRKAQLPDWTWAQCDNCLKWRRLPGVVNSGTLPDKWFCYMNTDPTHK